MSSASLGVDDPINYRLDNYGALRHLHLSTGLNDRHPTMHSLNDLGHSVYARGFGDRLHEGIVSRMAVDYLENKLYQR